MNMVRPVNRAERISLMVLLLASLVLVVLVVRPFAGALFMAAVLAVAFHSTCRRLTAILRGNRACAAFLLTLGLVFALVLPVASVTVVAMRETIRTVDSVHETLATQGVEGLLHRAPPALQPRLERFWNQLPSSEQNSRFIFDLERRAAAVIPNLAHTAGEMVVQATLMLIALFFLLLEGERVVAWLHHVTPLQKNQLRVLAHEFCCVSRTVVFGTVATAIAQSLVALPGYLIAHAPNPFFLTLFTFFVALVPVLGAGVFSFAISVYLLLTGHLYAAIFLGLWSVLVVGLVDNVLKPLFMKGGIEMHGGLVFFALIGGLAAFGPAGLVLGPLSLTSLLASLRIYRRELNMSRDIRAAA